MAQPQAAADFGKALGQRAPVQLRAVAVLARVGQGLIDDVLLPVLARDSLDVQRALAQARQVAHGGLGVGGVQVGQHALADHQVKRRAGAVVQHRAALPAKALAQVGADLHAVELRLRKMPRHHIAPQPDAAAHIQHAQHRHAQVVQVAAHKGAQALDVLRVGHAGFGVEVKALVVGLVKVDGRGGGRGVGCRHVNQGWEKGGKGGGRGQSGRRRRMGQRWGAQAGKYRRVAVRQRRWHTRPGRQRQGCAVFLLVWGSV